MQIRRKLSFEATAWKNGGGITHEAIRVPPSGEPFHWRISVAHIEASGPFSDFAAYRRHMALLRGAGLKLNFADGEHAVLRAVGDLVEFDGARPTHCELLAGACVDLNLIQLKSMPAARARVQRLYGPLALCPSPHESAVVFCIEGALSVGSEAGECATLEEWDLAVLSHADIGSACRASPRSAAPPLAFLATLADA
jgi:environmental stress-induced protein Ves